MAEISTRFGDLEQTFGLPSGSTKMDSKRIRKTETEIIRRTNELKEKSKSDSLVEYASPQPTSAVSTQLEHIDLMLDTTDIPIEDRIARGKEFCRREAIEMYNSCKDASEMLKSELMPGAPASMWLAYSNLIKTLLDCKKEIGHIYDKLDEEIKFLSIPTEVTEKDDKVNVSVDDLMDLVKAAVSEKKKVKMVDIIEVGGSDD